MKKNVIAIIILAAAVSLAGCGSQSEETAEAAAEEETAEAAAEEETAEAAAEEEDDSYITVDWDMDLIEDLDGVIGGVWDMELVAGEGTRADIRDPLWYDEDIVRVVMIDTGDVNIVTPGIYEATYDICFNREPLLEWMEENGIDSSRYPGMDSDAGRLFVSTATTVTVTEAP